MARFLWIIALALLGTSALAGASLARDLTDHAIVSATPLVAWVFGS